MLPRIDTHRPTTLLFRVTVKSYIAPIGKNIGFMPGDVFFTDNRVRRQDLLVAFAAATDLAYSENPRRDAKDKRYRLFSSCLFSVTVQHNRIIGLQQSKIETDTGKEGPFQAPPLIVESQMLRRIGATAFEFGWFGTGCPHPEVEPSFQVVLPRTCRYIWHEIRGIIDLGHAAPLKYIDLKGSMFPSHRAFVNNLLIEPTVKQRNLTHLWTPTPTEPKRVL